MSTPIITLAPLLPLAAGAALLPLWITITLLLLRSDGGVAKAAAYAGGAIAVRVVQGVVFGYLFAGAPGDGDTGKPDLIVATLELLAGIVLLVTGAGSWLRKEDPEAPPPRWMTALRGMRATRALALGTVMMLLSMKQWVFTLSAVAVIHDADLPRPGSVAAYLAFVVAAHSLVLGPTVLYAASPGRAGGVIDAATAWLERNGRPVTAVASLVFGLLFLRLGIAGLHANS